MKLKELLIGASLFLIGQTIAWYQTNGQFINSWIKDHPLLISLLVGMPCGAAYIYGTTYLMESSGGLLWPVRIIGFATGMITFGILTSFHLGEGITLKTGVMLSLAALIILIQTLWK